MAATRAVRKRSDPRRRWVRRLKVTGVLLIILVLAVYVGAMALYLPIRREAQEDVANIEAKTQIVETKPTQVVSRDGKVLYSIATERRKVVDINRLPKYVRDAVVAAEDRRFYDHNGVDKTGVARAVFTAAKTGRASQGGSTITMQIAKQMVNGSDRTFLRKLRDVAVAQEIEQVKSKDQILNLYMNSVYFGEGARGIQAAAETYFNKDAKDLTIAEAAMLARCIRTPSRDNPLREKRVNKTISQSLARRDYVLGVMHDEGWITESEYNKAIDEKPKLNPTPPRGLALFYGAPYFVRHAIKFVENDIPGIDLSSGGYKIETTLDYELQKVGESAMRRTLSKFARNGANTGALVLMNRLGQILVEVGGPAANTSQFLKRELNNVTQGRMQPGSSFKPFVYASAFKDGKLSVDGMVENTNIRESSTGEEWSVEDHHHFGQKIPVLRAIASSVNPAAVHAIQTVGPQTVVAYAHDCFGFRSPLGAYDSLALGTSRVSPIEMLEGYSVFMLHGYRVSPYPVTRVLGPGGEVVKEYQPTIHQNAFDTKASEDVEKALRQVVLSGTGTRAARVPNACGKTGTTDSAKDLWFCGYSDGLAAVGWVGNERMIKGIPHALPIRGDAYGGTITVYMWTELMERAHEKYGKPIDYTNPFGDFDVKPNPATSPAPKATPEDDKPEPDVPALGAKPPATDAAGAPAKIDDGQAVPDNPDGPTMPDDQTGTALPDEKPATDPPKGHPPRGHKKPQDDNTVTVDICADTGLRATMYCPETVTRTYPKGSEPKKSCDVHKG